MSKILTSDDSGHWYIIPIELKDEFNILVSDEYGWEDDRWDKYNDMMVDSPESILILDYEEL